MSRISNYFTIYFIENVSDKAEHLKEAVDTISEFCPFSLGYADSKPTSGKMNKDIKKVINKYNSLIDTPRGDGEVFLNLKDGKNNNFKAGYHLFISANNLTYIPSQKVYLPNFVQLYFPDDLEKIDTDRFNAILQIFEELSVKLNAIYGYVNKAVMYDMYHVASDNKLSLDILAKDNTVDVFDDFNEYKHFVEKIKTPMWLNILSRKHIDNCPALLELHSSRIDVLEVGGGLWKIQLKQELNCTDDAPYKELAQVMYDISLDDFHPVMFKFPYKYPHKYSRIWINRFRE